MKNLPAEFELITIRQGHRYDLFPGEPDAGEWWAVRAVSVVFPDDSGFALTTPDGASVEQFCVVAAQRQQTTGLWQWCHLSPVAKRLFGDLIFDNCCDRTKWWYVVESKGGK